MNNKNIQNWVLKTKVSENDQGVLARVIIQAITCQVQSFPKSNYQVKQYLLENQIFIESEVD